MAGDFWDILALSRSARLKLLPCNDFYEHTVEFLAYVTCDPTAHSVTDVFIMSDMKEIGETGKDCHSSQFLFRKADFSFKKLLLSMQFIYYYFMNRFFFRLLNINSKHTT